jgi:hypothetical protein
MEHMMRAEYAEQERAEEGPAERAQRAEHPERTVRSWHMVRGHQTQAMCGRELTPDAELRSDEYWGRTAEPMCHTCGALYLREVP